MTGKIESLENMEILFERIDELWNEDEQMARDHYSSSKGIKVTDIARHAMEKGKLQPYLRERIFKGKKGGYYVIQNGEIANLNKTVFNDTIRSKINSKHPELAKSVCDDVDKLYYCDVFDNETVIDRDKKVINLARKFNFRYDKNAPQDKVNGEKIFGFFKEVITSNIEEQFECLLDILAGCTHRIKSQVITLLIGLGGSGKTFFMDILKEMFGSAFAEVCDKVMSGETPFNKPMIGSVIVSLCEMQECSNYDALMENVKKMSTAKTLEAREMFSDYYSVTNMSNYFLQTNNASGINPVDRRFFAPTISSKYQGNREHFARLTEICTKEALQYVFNVLYERKVKYPIKPPDTEMKDSARLCSMDSCGKFIIHEFIIKQNVSTIKRNKAYEQYLAFCKEQGIKKTYGLNNFAKKWMQFVPHAEGFSAKHPQYDVSRETLCRIMVGDGRFITQKLLDELTQELEDNKQEALDELWEDKSYQAVSKKLTVAELDILRLKARIEELEAGEGVRKIKQENENLKKRIAELEAKKPEKDNWIDEMERKRKQQVAECMNGKREVVLMGENTELMNRCKLLEKQVEELKKPNVCERRLTVYPFCDENGEDILLDENNNRIQKVPTFDDVIKANGGKSWRESKLVSDVDKAYESDAFDTDDEAPDVTPTIVKVKHPYRSKSWRKPEMDYTLVFE